MQQGFTVAFMLRVRQPTLNYSDIQSIFGKYVPLDTFGNAVSAKGQNNLPLFKSYEDF